MWHGPTWSMHKILGSETQNRLARQRESYAKLSEDRFSEIQSEAKLREISKIGQKFNSSYFITMSVFFFHIRNKRSSNFSEDKFVRLTVKMLPALLNSNFSVSLSLFVTRIIRIFA